MLIRLMLRLELKTTNAVESVGLVPGQGVPTSQSQQKGHTEGGDHDDHQYYQSLHFYFSLHGMTRCNSEDKTRSIRISMNDRQT